MRNLKKFDDHSEYENFVSGPDYKQPNISYCKAQNEIHWKQKAAAKISIRETSSPQGSAYSEGETIAYAIDVKNTGALLINTATVQGTISNTNFTKSLTNIAPSQTKTESVSHVVTSSDTSNGYVQISTTATVEGTDNTPVSINSEKQTPVSTPKAQLTITATETSRPNNGDAYGLGEPIVYNVTITNDGDITVTGITLYVNGSQEGTIASLSAGGSRTIQYSHEVTEADILEADGSGMQIEFDATGYDPNGNAAEIDPYQTSSSSIEEPDAHISIAITTTSQPENDSYYTVGEEIIYAITVTNDGNIKVENIDLIYEQGNVDFPEGTYCASLEAGPSGNGETWEMEASHTVTSEDVENGEYVLEVSATAYTSDGDDADVEPGNSGGDPCGQ